MSRSGIIPDDRLSALTHAEIVRYSRHLLSSEVGLGGRKCLKAVCVLPIGTDGLGAPVALYLTAAGAGRLGIAGLDFVDISNLQRQIVHSTRDISHPRVASARDKIKTISPETQVKAYNITLSSKNAFGIIREYDLVVDGTDNYPIRYLISDACVLLGKPLVHGSIFQFKRQVSVFYAGQGPCYRCPYPEPPPPRPVPSCAEGGAAGVLSGIIGTIQAAETIRLTVSGSKSLIGRLLPFNAWQMKQRELRLGRGPGYPVYGEHPSTHVLIDYGESCGLKPDKLKAPTESVTTFELHAWIGEGKSLQLIGICEPHERTVTRFPQAKAVPLGQIVRHIGEFDLAIDAVFLCKIGQCSIFAIRTFQHVGYQGRVMNLRDGLNVWTRDVDTRLPQY